MLTFRYFKVFLKIEKDRIDEHKDNGDTVEKEANLNDGHGETRWKILHNVSLRMTAKGEKAKTR